MGLGPDVFFDCNHKGKKRGKNKKAIHIRTQNDSTFPFPGWGGFFFMYISICAKRTSVPNKVQYFPYVDEYADFSPRPKKDSFSSGKKVSPM